MVRSELLSLDLTGKTYVITGANSGIGLVAAQQQARQGATVVMGVRRVREGERVAVNNAGVMKTPFGHTKDGFETRFGGNRLGHFPLTNLLTGALQAGAPSRVVNLSSFFHEFSMGRKGEIHFDDLNYHSRKFDSREAYAQSKLANRLHARELGRRLHGGVGQSRLRAHQSGLRSTADVAAALAGDTRDAPGRDDRAVGRRADDAARAAGAGSGAAVGRLLQPDRALQGQGFAPGRLAAAFAQSGGA